MSRDCEEVTNVKGFKTHAEANAYRKTFLHSDMYGLFQIWRSDDDQMWCVLPKAALYAIMNFKEPSND